MAVNYRPLWIELAKREMKKLEKICKFLECTPNDIIEFQNEVKK